MSTSHHSADSSGIADYVVYRLLGEDFRLLYIGCTGNLATRLGQHRTKRPWWSEVVCYSLERHGADRAGALVAERAAILSEQPPYNSVRESRSAAERFWEKVDIGAPDECWNWTAGSHTNGYGQFGFDVDHPRTAHSAAYELTHGVRSTKSASITQTCGNRLCVNPAHLVVGRASAFKTHCKHGHPYDEANTYRTPRGARQCRACLAVNARAYYARKKALAA